MLLLLDVVASSATITTVSAWLLITTATKQEEQGKGRKMVEGGLRGERGRAERRSSVREEQKKQEI